MRMNKQLKIQRKTGGFTLVELLVVIGLIATVSSMFLVAYRGAVQESFTASTATTIRKISEVLNSRMQEYEAFPVSPMMVDLSVIPSGPSYSLHLVQIPSDAAAKVFPDVGPGQPNPLQETTTKLLERARLLSLRQIIRLEMPDHPDDLKWTNSWLGGTPIAAHVQGWLSNNYALSTGLTSPSMGEVYTAIAPPSRAMRLIERLSTYDSGSGTMRPISGWETTNANAELLYLIVEDSVVNGSQAIELFGKSEIGDTDGDGLYEFLDAWRNPIRWVRWPAGSGVSSRYYPDMLDPTLTFANVASDPFDRMRADPGYIYGSPTLPLPGGGLFPLVVSAGPDKRFGIRLQYESPVSTTRSSMSSGDVEVALPYSASGVTSFISDPWYPRAGTESSRLGSVLTNTSRPAFNATYPNITHEYYDIAQEAQDNVTSIDVLGGSL